MAAPVIAIVGAGPAGTRAAEAVVAAGLRPVVIDEGMRSGGQIYRRQPANFSRIPAELYGFDAAKARALHRTFDDMIDKIDYRPETSVWNVRGNTLFLTSADTASEIEFDAVIFATGATDRLAPIDGWTLPGCFSLGGSQIALKAQACAIGSCVTFVGTGPLLYLIAYQYAKAGVAIAAVLDTSPFSRQVKAVPYLLVRPSFLARGLLFRSVLLARGIRVYNGATPLAVVGDERVRGVRFRTARGRIREVESNAVGIGFHLRSETQLADLAGCGFRFDTVAGQWRPEVDEDGRSDRVGVYLAGDGVRILGADAAETAGRLAACAALTDLGLPQPDGEMRRLRKRMTMFEHFRKGLLVAFPWPGKIARDVPDDVIVCRCEAIRAGAIRQAAAEAFVPELNRAKALVRVGMGRCQGRFCGSAAAEILAAARDVALADVGRIRGQAPVRPLSVAVREGEG